jgi:hypothetical protein
MEVRSKLIGSLLGLLFDPEDGGDMFLRNVGYFQRITERYIPKHRTLQLKSNNIHKEAGFTQGCQSAVKSAH